jgi:hypothetical protein
MARVRRAHRHSIRVLSAVLVLLGAAMVASTLARGGGPLSVGVVLGLLLGLLGVGRLLLSRQGRAARSGGA